LVRQLPHSQDSTKLDEVLENLDEQAEGVTNHVPVWELANGPFSVLRLQAVSSWHLLDDLNKPPSAMASYSPNFELDSATWGDDPEWSLSSSFNDEMNAQITIPILSTAKTFDEVYANMSDASFFEGEHP